MKQAINILTFIFISATAVGQADSLKVGDKWEFEYPTMNSNGVGHGLFVFNEGLCAVVYQNKLGFIDTFYNIVIPLKFVVEKSAPYYKFVDSKAIVSNEGKYGIIDTTGKIIVPFKYDEIRKHESYYFVYLDYKNGYINSKGDEVVPVENEWPAAPYRTDEDIEKLIEQQKVEEQAEVSKKQAIKIAKKKGYYHNDAWPFTPNIELDTISNVWIIKSTVKKGTTKKGDCAHTNGCIVHMEYEIVIDSNNGRVQRKSKHKTLMPIFE